MLTTRFEFIHFEPLPSKGITSKWSCRNNRSGDELGQVAWYGPWRQYVYEPSQPAVYSRGCLQDIDKFVGQLESERVAQLRKANP